MCRTHGSVHRLTGPTESERTSGAFNRRHSVRGSGSVAHISRATTSSRGGRRRPDSGPMARGSFHGPSGRSLVVVVVRFLQSINWTLSILAGPTEFTIGVWYIKVYWQAGPNDRSADGLMVSAWPLDQAIARVRERSSPRSPTSLSLSLSLSVCVYVCSTLNHQRRTQHETFNDTRPWHNCSGVVTANCWHLHTIEWRLWYQFLWYYGIKRTLQGHRLSSKLGWFLNKRKSLVEKKQILQTTKSHKHLTDLTLL